MPACPEVVMRTVAIVSQKGGAGKTTLAVHLATAAMQAGLAVLIIDTDPQATASRWSQWRRGQDPDVVDCGAPSLLAAKLAKAAELGAQLWIIDSPPHADLMARQAAKLADLVLIPCRPKAFDLAAVEATAELVRSGGKPAFVVFTAGPPRAPLIYREAALLIAGDGQDPGLGVPIAPVTLPDRAAFHHSTAQGLTAGETDPNGKAAREVRALWAWTCEQLGLSSSLPVHTGERAA
jgi:chromosome partitioning protein